MTPRPPGQVYSVPKRFGIGSILAFTTLFAVVLAFLTQRIEPPMWVYLFIGLMGLTVCVAQMLTSGVPRQVSIAAGAICLPLLSLGTIIYEGESIVVGVLMMPPLAVVGAIAGYLMGTIAAGVFLVGDLFEKRLRGIEPIKAELVDDDGEPIPVYTPDACTPYLGPSAAQLTKKPPMHEKTQQHAARALGPPTGIPVYTCRVLISPPGSDGLVRARAAELSDLKTSGATEREALQNLVGAFKIIVTQCQAEGREPPFLSQPHAPESGEQERYIPVHL